YRVTDIEADTELEIDNQYIMSPKDLCTIGFLNKLLDSGVRVLKIEGRARGPEYVHTVTSCYREAVEAWLDGTYSDEAKIAAWIERLSQVFNRGFWDGYYLGQKMGEWSHTYGSQATRRKVYLGKCTNWFSRLGVAEFVMETGSLKTGDSVLITGVTTGVAEVVVGELRLEYDPVGEVKKGDRFSLKTGVQVHRGDRLFRWDSVLPNPTGS
ncbi:MAG: peptidase U32 family protein, partial [Bacteroidales bacterium]